MSIDNAADIEAEYEVYSAAPLASEGRPAWTRVVAGILAITILALLVVGLAWRLSATAPPAPAATAEYDVTAVSWQGLALPISATSGPATFTDTRSKGFAQTDLGAALAAVHLSSHIDPYTGPAVFGPTIDEQVIGDTAALKKLVTATYTDQAKKHQVADGAPILAPTGQMKAWRIDAFTPTGVNNVEIYVGTPTGTDVIYTIGVQWVDGDWKLKPTVTEQGISFAVSDPNPDVDYTAFTAIPTTGDPQ